MAREIRVLMQDEIAATRLPSLRRYFPGRCCLILVMGVAGSGKTRIAREILRHVWAVYLDNNHIADAFFPDTRNAARYHELRAGFYDALYTIAEENLKLGNSVLLDVPHVKEIQSRDWRSLIQAIVMASQAKMIVLRCVCSEQVLRARLISRGEKRDQWKLKHWKEFLKQQPIKVRIPFPHLDINTEGNTSTNVRAAIRYIRTNLQLERSPKA